MCVWVGCVRCYVCGRHDAVYVVSWLGGCGVVEEVVVVAVVMAS